MQPSDQKHLITGAVTLFFIVSISIAFYLGRQSMVVSVPVGTPAPDTIADIPAQVATEPMSTEVETGLDTSDWQTFHDDQLGIEFKYPADSTPVQALPSSGMYNIEVNDPSTCANHGGCSDFFSLTVFVDPHSPSFISYQELLPKTKYIDGTLGGLPVKKLVNADGSPMAGGLGVTKQKFYTTNKYGYFFNTGSLTDPTVKAIIDSFKFL